MMKHYGNHEFWQERYYMMQDPFDWYLRMADIDHLIGDYIKSNFTYLDVGCGTSRVYEYLFEKGCQKIIGIDFCYELIMNLNQKLNPAYVNLVKFICMDARKMDFDDAKFDVVLDKGTLDCVLCADTSLVHIQKYFEEIDKHLNEGGHYILISFGEPQYRDKYLKRDGWSHTVQEIPMLDFNQKIEEPVKGKNGKPVSKGKPTAGNNRSASQPRGGNQQQRNNKKPTEPEQKVFYLYICKKSSKYVSGYSKNYHLTHQIDEIDEGHKKGDRRGNEQSSDDFNPA